MTVFAVSEKLRAAGMSLSQFLNEEGIIPWRRKEPQADP